MDIGILCARRGAFRVVLFTLLVFTSGPLWALSVFINELHYDNAGGDVGEGIEVAGPAGTDLTGWQLLLYNGGNGQTYGSALTLEGRIPDEGVGMGTLALEVTGIQNGGPDGLALLDDQGVVQQFISYEGVLTATSGPAAGLTSSDIGLEEGGDTPEDWSLQLLGDGMLYADFHWGAGKRTLGTGNIGQLFEDNNFHDNPLPTPLPGSLVLMLSALSGFAGYSRLKGANR